MSPMRFPCSSDVPALEGWSIAEPVCTEGADSRGLNQTAWNALAPKFRQQMRIRHPTRRPRVPNLVTVVIPGTAVPAHDGLVARPVRHLERTPPSHTRRAEGQPVHTNRARRRVGQVTKPCKQGTGSTRGPWARTFSCWLKVQEPPVRNHSVRAAGPRRTRNHGSGGMGGLLCQKQESLRGEGGVG